ncbi:MAG: CHASE2 domain-containing protein [Rubrivivax sp.]|nr:CHASE2 domain-containing protein [Rubrivivax sp.]
MTALTPLPASLARGALDTQLRLLAPRSASPDVLVVDIDDASLAALKPHFGSWPFKRDVYALVIEQLRELGARAVAIDLLLADSGPGDAALARAQARPGAPVLLAAAGMRHASDGALPPHSAAAAAPSAAGAAGQLAAGSSAAVGHAWPTIAVPAASVWPPGRAPLLGVITTPLDEDGVLRTLPLWHHDTLQRLPVMPWAVQQAVAGPGAAPPPLDAQGRYRLAMPAAGAWPAQRRFAEVAEVALGRREAADLGEAVRGRVVFIGSSALLADAVMTPQGQASGTMALAQAYAAFNQGSWACPPAPALDGLLLLVALLPGGVIVWRGRPAPARDTLLAAGALLAMIVVALSALWQWRQPSDWVPPLATLLTVWTAALSMHHRGQAAARQRLAHELAVSAEAARAKDAFLANVSHEIRTPLNALLGVAELLSQSDLSPRQRLQVQVFRESGQALHSLINDLLDLSRIEAGRLDLHPAPFDLRESLARIIALLRVRAEDKGLNLVLELADTLPAAVLGDRLRLEQALINLVGNALKFTARGEVRLAARADPQLPGMLRFDVVDTGIGIAPSKLAAIFEPFAQADGSVTRLYGGTGLGLSITRSIAQLMGGSVQVQSTPGTGSTFTLRLPLPAAALPAGDGTGGEGAAAAAPAAPADNAASVAALWQGSTAPPAPGAMNLASQGAPLSLLLAEDNEINAFLFRSMLEGQPLALEFASNGPAALAMLRERRYDIAFIDVQMPGMDGLTVTRQLRALEADSGRPRTPVVALTANAFASDVLASREAGCDRHMAKPYSRAQLIEAIQQLAAPLSAAPPPRSPHGSSGETVLDRTNAVQRLGGDAALYDRLAEHAAVFMTEWSRSFARARGEGSRERAFRLAHDLKTIASSIGALAVVEHAMVLEQSLRGDGQGPVDTRVDERALERTLDALPPVIAALTKSAPAAPDAAPRPTTQ